ncbi:hypothetical protein ACLQ28_14730 [Micromonospora sp. DT201]|uniref:hypothetical protein n=1 Tax=Micromonospora sp. DT201 TaxID=3393442 RepID=UPI003CF9EC83
MEPLTVDNGYLDSQYNPGGRFPAVTVSGRSDVSISSYLVCPSRKLIIGLGKRLRDPNGAVTGFSIGNHLTSEDPQLTQAMWKFLADTAGEEVVVKFSDDEEFEEIAGYQEIGGDEYDDISFEDYLRSGSQG